MLNFIRILSLKLTTNSSSLVFDFSSVVCIQKYGVSCRRQYTSSLVEVYTDNLDAVPCASLIDGIVPHNRAVSLN